MVLLLLSFLVIQKMYVIEINLIVFVYFFFFCFLKSPDQQVAIKQITKKQLAKSQSLLEKEIKILKVKQMSLF